MKKLLLLLSICTYLFSTNINYTKSDIHAFIPQKGQLSILVELQKTNDQLDILNIKEDEFSSSTNGYDNLGDMDGLKLELRYSIFDNLYLNTKYNKKELEYASSTLINTNIDIYLRYNIYQNNNFAISIDGGYEINKADDLKISDLKTINDTIAKVLPNNDASIEKVSGIYKLNYTKDGTVNRIDLTLNPYLSINDTQDKSLYSRVILSYKFKNLLFDLYSGYKQIKIYTSMDSSIAHEPNTDIQNELNSGSSKASYSTTREDGMIYWGTGIRYHFSQYIAGELNYQYNKILRINCLKEMDENHILNANLLFGITRSTIFYMGGQIMSNQFNGEIPYLYTQYTKTAFDHKYGYANFGFIFKF